MSPAFSTVKVTKAPPFLNRILVAILGSCLCLGFAVVLLFIPIIGWFFALGLLFLAVAAPFSIYKQSKEPSYSGECPYCGSTVNAGRPSSVIKCPACTNRFVHRNGILSKIEK